MYWVIFFTIFFALNESTFSWRRSLSSGQVSCDSCLQRLLASSNFFTNATKKGPSEINTWYPIPKWKALFNGQRNRNGDPKTYFSKQGSAKGTDANVFGNSFSSIPDLQTRVGVFRRLNIQFLPSKDGNITVNGSERKINEKADVELIALFVAYATFLLKNNGEMLCNSSREFESEKRENSRFYDESNKCNVASFKPYFTTIEYVGELMERGEKIASIPLTANMSIDMKISRTDDNNYTISVTPFSKNNSATANNNRDIKSLDGNITLKLPKNMNIVIKTNNQYNLNEYLKNDSRTFNLNDTKNFTEEFRNGESDNYFTGTYFFEEMEKSQLNNSRNESVLGGTNNETQIVLNTTSESNRIKEDIETNTLVLQAEYNVNNTSFINTNLNREKNNTSTMTIEESNTFDSNVNLNVVTIPTDEFDLKNQIPGKNESQMIIIKYEKENETNSGLSKLPANGPLNSDFFFSATISLTIFNNDKKDKTEYMIHVSFYKANHSNISVESLNNNGSQSFVSEQNITETEKNATYSSLLQKYQNSSKGPVIKDELVPLDRNKTSNTYLSRTVRMILNKRMEESRGNNPFSLILQREKTKGQNYSRRLFLFQKVLDSYASPTIANNNEEFNQKGTNNFRNNIRRKLPDYTTPVYNSKSNQMAYDAANKRNVILPELIPNKDLGENRFFSKKSELQMVDGASFDKTLDSKMMKIPSWEQNLAGNDIKTGKICGVESGCIGINDIFNRQSALEYQKEDREKKHSSESIGSSKMNTIIDQYMKMQTHQNVPFKRLRLNIDEEINSKKSEIPIKWNTSLFKFWLDLDNFDFFQKNVLVTLDSTIKNARNLKMANFWNYNFTNPDKNKELLINKIRGLSLDTKRNSDNMRHHFYTKQLVKKVTKPIDILKRSVIFKDDLERSLPSLIRLRRKRSEQDLLKNYFPLIKSSMVPNPVSNSPSDHFSRIHSMSRNSSNAPSHNVILRFTKSPNDNKIPSTKRYSSPSDTSRRLSNSELSSKIQNKPNEWVSGREWDDNTLSNRNGPQFKWIIIFPEVIKSNHENSLILRDEHHFNKPSNPHRETEGYDKLNEEVDNIDSSGEQKRKKNVSKTTPMSLEKPPYTINTPFPFPNFVTTKSPIRKTTTKPNFPFIFNTHKPSRYPQLHTTTKSPSGSSSWSATRPWSDFTPWFAAKPWIVNNPWSNFQPWSNAWPEFRPWGFDGWTGPQNSWNNHGTAQMMNSMISHD